MVVEREEEIISKLRSVPETGEEWWLAGLTDRQIDREMDGWVGATFYSIFSCNGDIEIPVKSALFVPSSQSMEYLVLHNPRYLTPFANGYVLLASCHPNW